MTTIKAKRKVIKSSLIKSKIMKKLFQFYQILSKISIMKVICGLGNPGKEFKFTRHNLGFLVLDNFQKKNSFPEFKFSEKFLAEISRKKIKEIEILLLKPQTFMNESGKAIKKIFSSYKIEPQNLCVVHDDLDLPFGKMKISFKRGSGGHKGVQSIIDEILTKDFWRIRIGIGRPKNKKTKEYVLEEFEKEEKEKLNEILKFTNELIKIWIENPQKAQALASSFSFSNDFKNSSKNPQ
jgi:PTH1 family peptidyl-tRNA hydrolase